jgi:transposase
MSTMTNLGTYVTVGVDTHLETHVAVALDQVGRVLAQQSFTADPPGYRSLLRWSRALGQVHAFGIEGTGCYGAVLAGTATGIPKNRDGDVESIRALRVARRGAVRIRIQVANQLHALVISAPEPVREKLAPAVHP